MVNSRAKGKRGELEFAAFLRRHSIGARRGQQFAGGADSPDVITDLDFVHFEVKRVEAGNPYKWFAQALKDAAIDRIPIVAHRRSHGDWLAVLSMADLLDLIQVVEDAGGWSAINALQRPGEKEGA